MTSVATKICGLSTIDGVDAAVAGGASHAGFVFYPASPRHIAPAEARALVQRLPSRVRPVAVMVDPDDALVAAAVHAGIDTVQLHGTETPERAYGLSQRFGIAVWKAIPVRTHFDLAAAGHYAGAVSLALFDAKPPPGAASPGGMGLRFDWRLLEGHRHLLPWGLSGGLDADNVAEAIRATGATLVDVSSGVESAPGVKDVDKVAAFLQAVARP